MLLLFVKGEKGLTAIKAGKFHFPDRNSNIKEEGLYECEVTVEKEKYAFVKGNLIETYMPSEHIIQEKLNLILSDKAFMKINAYEVKKIGLSIIGFIASDDIIKITYYNENGAECKYTSYVDTYRKDHNVSKLYNKMKFVNADGYDVLEKKAIMNAAKVLSGNELLSVATAAIIRHIGHAVEKLNVFKLINDKFIIIETEWHHMKTKSIYIYNIDCGIIKLPLSIYFEDEIESESERNIDIGEIKQYMIENHIGSESYNHEPTYVKNISFMGAELNIECINGRVLLENISEEEKDRVAESFELYESFRKRLGKHISRSMVSEFSKLAPSNIWGIRVE
jgi:hypothetical protein